MKKIILISISILSILIFSNLSSAYAADNDSMFVKPIITHPDKLDLDFNLIDDEIDTKITNCAGQSLCLDQKIDVIVILKEPYTQTDIDEFKSLGGAVADTYNYVTYGFSGKIDLGKIASFKGNIGTKLNSIEINRKGHSSMDVATQITRLNPVVWNNYGYTGDPNSAVAIIDSGIDTAHNDLGDPNNDNCRNNNHPEDCWSNAASGWPDAKYKVVGWHDSCSMSCVLQGYPRSNPADTNTEGHGTRCAGIVAGTGEINSDYRGVANNTRLVGVRISDDNGGWYESEILAGFDWVKQWKSTYRIRVVSVSQNSYQTSSTLDNAANSLVESGIVTVVSAGNGYDDSPEKKVTSPGEAAKVITVGATNDNDKVTFYSSNGNTGSNKPDVVAPGGSGGVDCGGGELTRITTTSNNPDDTYSDHCGTSFSAPHVAGLAALIIQAMGGSYSQNEANALFVKNIILMTAAETNKVGELSTGGRYNTPPLNRGDKDLVEGYGRIDADAAIEAVTMEHTIGSTDTSSLGSGTTDKKVWARKVNLISGKMYVFDLTVPVGADYDLYLYDTTPTSSGDPIIDKKSINSALFAPEHIEFVPTTSGYYYIIVKWVSGSGSFSLTSAYGVNCGDTIDHSLTLINDLTGCQGHGIIIGADSITLDCHNHLISGTMAGSSYGIYLLFRNGVTIKYCNIQQFEVGIELVTSSHNILDNNMINNNKWGMVLDGANPNEAASTYNEIRNSVSQINQISGLNLQNTNHNDVHDNYFSENTFYGVLLIPSQYNKFWKNDFINNGYKNAYEYDNAINNQWYDSNTNTGNYWDDFATNPMCPQYEIPGPGDGIDYYPLNTEPCTAPDLIIEDIWTQGRIIYYRIKNQGDADVNVDTYSRLTVDGVWIYSDLVSKPLLIGESRVEWYGAREWVCSGVSDVIKVKADDDNYVDEKSETNNEREEIWMCPTTTTTIPPGGGCPYVSTWNGYDYVEDNNLMPFSEKVKGDVEDYYKLEQPLVEKDGKYSILLKEFEHEHDYFDQVKLLAVDHDSSYDIAVDSQGKILTYKNTITALSAIDDKGNDVTNILSSVDEEYNVWIKGEYITLDFGKVEGKNAKLLVRDPVRTPPPVPYKVSIHIQVLVDDEWKEITYIIPRNNWATDIVDLSKDIKPGEELKIRLYFTDTHRVDFVGLDTSEQEEIEVKEARLISAIHSTQGKVEDKVLKADKKYAELIPGQEIKLEFDVPEITGDARDFILVSRGRYYHVEENLFQKIFNAVSQTLSKR